MSAHILHVIRHAKKETGNPITEMGLLTYYKAGVDLAQWGSLLDLRDLCYIEHAHTWEELLGMFAKMEQKYQSLWKLAGKPADFETWSSKLPYWKKDSVGKEYWDVLNAEIDYGFDLKERNKEVSL